jgi:hypothetical protein
MKFSYTTLLYVLFLAFVLTLPFNSIYDTIAFFTGTVGDKTYAKTPIWFKLYKDIFLISAILLTIFHLILKLNVRMMGVVFFLVVVFVYAVFAVFQDANIAIVFAVRSYLSVFFIFLGFYYYQFDPIKVYPSIKFIFIIEIIIQVFQVFYAPNYYGSSIFGYNLTNPGTFLIPSTMASFAILTLYYARQKNERFIEILCVVSVLLSRSSTAYLIILVFYCIQAAKHFRFSFQLISAVVLILGVIVYFNLDTITGRPLIIYNIYSRLDIFKEAVDYSFGKGFGLGSAGAVLLHVQEAVIADNTLNSLLINFGWIGFVVYVSFLYFFVRYFKYDNILLLSVVAFSVTMIIFEMTPFIQFFFYELGRIIRLRREENQLQPAYE